MLFRVTKRCCISKKYITRSCSDVIYAKEIPNPGSMETEYVYSESQKAILDMRTIKTNPTVRFFSDRSSATFFDYVFQVCEAEATSNPTCGAQFLENKFPRRWPAFLALIGRRRHLKRYRPQSNEIRYSGVSTVLAKTAEHKLLRRADL